jgi:Protein of unknown function (DUF3800)
MRGVPASFAIRSLVSGLPRQQRRERLLLMLQAYIDDSGNTGDSPVCVLAGYVASVANWEVFSDEWQLALEGPPRIEYFKMSQAMSQRGEFESFDEPLPDARLGMLKAIMNRHVLAGVVSMIPSGHYTRIFSGKSNPPMFDRPYFLSFYGIMACLMRFLKSHGVNERIQFIFDEDSDAERIKRSWDHFVEVAPDDFRPLLGGRPLHLNEMTHLPLQAADMVAWDVRRQFHEWDRNRDHKSRVLDDLRNIEHVLDIWDEGRLQEIAEALRGTPLEAEEGTKMTLPDPTSRPWP